MRHLHCIAQGDEEGDCFRVCLAMVLNVDPLFVPHFAEIHKGKDSFHDEADAWLAQFGLVQGNAIFAPNGDIVDFVSQIPIFINNISPGCPAIVAGATERGRHSAVAWNGIWYDPARGVEPGETLITGVPEGEEGFWFTFISVGPNFKLPVKHDGY